MWIKGQALAAEGDVADSARGVAEWRQTVVKQIMAFAFPRGSIGAPTTAAPFDLHQYARGGRRDTLIRVM